MYADKPLGRRELLVTAVVVGGGTCLAACVSPGADGGKANAPAEAEVSPAEDLMREHGVLKRILLAYREALRRIAAHEDLPPEPLADGAHIIREFIEDYHEKLEEDFLFPRFRRTQKHVELVKVLTEQHRAGRRLTDLTLHLSTAHGFQDADERTRLAEALQEFIRMYEPHEAREDTVLFPSFRELVTAHEYDALGRDFEKREHQLFGEEGFEKMVDRVATIEKKLGIYELAQFTPKS